MRLRAISAATGATFGVVVTSATAAFAHGGMASADELGRPLGASIALAFVCYWAVILWPSRKSQNGQPGRADPNGRRRRPRRTGFSTGGEADERSLKAIGRNGDG